jgi:hypothetical protein
VSIDPRYITNQTFQTLRDTISCALGSTVLFKNITYQNVQVPFDEALINQRPTQCAGRHLRLLQTADLIIHYVILNPTINTTELETLLRTNPSITTLVQNWNAPPPISAKDTNSDLAWQIGVPLGAFALIIVVAVVIQVSLRRRQISPVRKSVNIIETPNPTRTLRIQSTAEEEMRAGHPPLRISIA